jgi:hypothetical protein
VLLRVIADPMDVAGINIGDSVGLVIRSLMVFEDAGENDLEILT